MEIRHEVIKQMFSCKSVSCNIPCMFPPQILCTASTRERSPLAALRMHVLHTMFLITDVLCSISLSAALLVHLVVFFKMSNDGKEFDSFVG